MPGRIGPDVKRMASDKGRDRRDGAAGCAGLVPAAHPAVAVRAGAAGCLVGTLASVGGEVLVVGRA